MKICSTRKVTPTANSMDWRSEARPSTVSSRRTTTRLLCCSTPIVNASLCAWRWCVTASSASRSVGSSRTSRPSGPRFDRRRDSARRRPKAGSLPRWAASSSRWATARAGTFRSGSSRQRCGSPASTSSLRASRPHDAATSGKEVSTALRMRAVIGLKAAGVVLASRRQGCPEMINRFPDRSSRNGPCPEEYRPEATHLRAPHDRHPDPHRHPAVRPHACDRRMESELGSVLRTRPRLDRKIHDHGRGTDALGRARRQDDGVPGDRRRCLVHPHVRPRCAPPHPQGAEARRHPGRNHRRAAAHQRAGHPHDEPGRTDPARRTGGARSRRDLPR